MANDESRRPMDGDRSLHLHAYLDGELDVASSLAAKREIDDDPALAAELASVSAMQTKLREVFPREDVSPALRARVMSLAPRRRIGSQPTWAAMAASVAVAALLSGTTTWLALRSDGGALRSEIVDTHVRALLSQRPTDVSSSDRHAVKPWFNSRLPEAPRVVDLGTEGFPLLGGRVDVVAGNPVPTLVYGRRLHVISLTATPARTGASEPGQASLRGYNIVSWMEGSLQFSATSDLNMGELNTFAKFIRSSP